MRGVGELAELGRQQIRGLLADVDGAVAAALVVVRLGRPVVAFLVRLVERVTDPVLGPLWRRRSRTA